MPVFRPTAFLLVPAAGLGLVLILYFLWSARQNTQSAAEPPRAEEEEKAGGPNAPSEWFYAQRVYPHSEIKAEDLARARNEGALLRQSASATA
ncbi:MAG TPA: hypothetical protein VNM87_10110, partial [Candidatus Udaeobacter sp.]|nr:hypothetical protein [Candidatus Udaeobacter sp.]